MATQITINGGNQFAEFVSTQQKVNTTANIDSEKLAEVDIQQSSLKAIEKNSLDEEEKNSQQVMSNKEKELESLELDDAIESITEFMHLSTQNVNFQRDDTTDKTIIKVYDSVSKELIKQFPSEEILEIAKKIAELRQDVGLKTGILLDEKV